MYLSFLWSYYFLCFLCFSCFWMLLMLVESQKPHWNELLTGKLQENLGFLRTLWKTLTLWWKLWNSGRIVIEVCQDLNWKIWKHWKVLLSLWKTGDYHRNAIEKCMWYSFQFHNDKIFIDRWKLIKNLISFQKHDDALSDMKCNWIVETIQTYGICWNL